jgi:hypothetical protein
MVVLVLQQRMGVCQLKPQRERDLDVADQERQTESNICDRHHFVNPCPYLSALASGLGDN